MKILLLTQYFPPETGAPQNRLYELAVRLQKMELEITVLTAMPNYPQMKIHPAYRGKLYAFEETEGLKIHRAWIYVSARKSVLHRLLNYFSFVFTSFFTGLFKTGRYDYILCESPPLFLGVSAYLLKTFKGAKLIFNVSDLWPESAEKLGIVTNKTLLKAATALEMFLYKRSAIITGQTQGIVSNIQERVPGKRVYWLPNGVDIALFQPDTNATAWRTKNGFEENDMILLYAGILGHGQGLEVILHAAEKLRDHPDIRFLITGDGPEKEKLLQLKEEKGLHNVSFKGVIPKIEMPEMIAGVDAAIIPLKKLPLFKGAIPSKIFETLAMQKPILLGVEGEAKTLFIEEGQGGLAFEPENAADLAAKIMLLYHDRNKARQLGENGRRYVSEKFTRAKIAADFQKYLREQPG